MSIVVIRFSCTRVQTVANLIGEEIECGRAVHTSVELPAELLMRIDELRPRD